jgi:hypothetical protein
LEKKDTQKCAFLTFSNEELLKLFVSNFSNSVFVFEIASFGRISRFSFHRSYKSVMYLLEKKIGILHFCKIFKFGIVLYPIEVLLGLEVPMKKVSCRHIIHPSMMVHFWVLIHSHHWKIVLNQIVPLMLGNGKLTIPIKLPKSLTQGRSLSL